MPKITLMWCRISSSWGKSRSWRAGTSSWRKWMASCKAKYVRRIWRRILWTIEYRNWRRSCVSWNSSSNNSANTLIKNKNNKSQNKPNHHRQSHSITQTTTAGYPLTSHSAHRLPHPTLISILEHLHNQSP